MASLQTTDTKVRSIFDTGDKEIRTWFLVNHDYLPIIICATYAISVTFIGPALMKNRKPMNLRIPMIIFNAFLVLSYTATLLAAIINFPKLSKTELFCKGGSIRKEGEATYKLALHCWILYMLKYIEFMDTVFFILRKKTRSLSFLHVVHHTLVPIIGWFLLRTETSGIESIPVWINAVVHVIMYTYYGLAALGPHMRPYLWWKKYVTLLQIAQFLFILPFTLVIIPLAGCEVKKYTVVLNITGALFFYGLFQDFYNKNFGNKTKKVE